MVAGGDADGVGVGQADVGRECWVSGTFQAGDDGGGGGVGGGLVDGVGAEVAGEHPVGGGEVVAVVVVHGADEGHAVHELGVAGEQLGELDAGDGWCRWRSRGRGIRRGRRAWGRRFRAGEGRRRAR